MNIKHRLAIVAGLAIAALVASANAPAKETPNKARTEMAALLVDMCVSYAQLMESAAEARDRGVSLDSLLSKTDPRELEIIGGAKAVYTTLASFNKHDVMIGAYRGCMDKHIGEK